MKPIYSLLFALFILASCQQTSQSQSATSKNNGQVSACINQATAERILGQTAKLTKSTSERTSEAMVYKCTYTALTPDPKSNRQVNLYYHFDVYNDVATASKAYRGVLSSNADMPGVKTLENFGDEASFHSDNENFCMIIARKGNKMLRIKLNKLTVKSSPDELQKVAKIIIDNA